MLVWYVAKRTEGLFTKNFRNESVGEKISAVVRFLYCNMCGMLCVRTMVDNDEDW